MYIRSYVLQLSHKQRLMYDFQNLAYVCSQISLECLMFRIKLATTYQKVYVELTTVTSNYINGLIILATFIFMHILHVYTRKLHYIVRS